jgi:MoxR-like ATPase
MAAKRGYLTRLGAFGFDAVEPVVLAALVTEDPLLVIGNSGTGKTFLLNSISEALGLEHRHYNASMVSFDDLVGFPFPDDEKSCVKFLETPATVWGAQSVLVDEISRCRPEHQNRLFSLVHERRVQGIALERLRFRWAAMNPCSMDQGGDYSGSEPLDRALADRFGLIVKVGDWRELSKANKRKVADPSGEGALSDDKGKLAFALAEWRAKYNELLPSCPAVVIDYACAAATSLGEARIRLSPRRVRMMSRSLLAVTVVSGAGPDPELFRMILECSLPHSAWGEEPRKEAIAAAHRVAWDSAVATGDRKWIHEFHLELSLAEKARMLFRGCPGPDAGSSAVAQLLASDRPERVAAFAMSLYPAASAGLVPSVGAEGVADLGRVAQEVLSVDGEIAWQERFNVQGKSHPEIERSSSTLKTLSGARRERATQLFNHLIVAKIAPERFEEIEEELEACVRAVAEEVRR